MKPRVWPCNVVMLFEVLPVRVTFALVPFSTLMAARGSNFPDVEKMLLPAVSVTMVGVTWKPAANTPQPVIVPLILRAAGLKEEVVIVLLIFRVALGDVVPMPTSPLLTS